MAKILIKNFGPIRDGYSEKEYLDIRKVTILIGQQGSGKSTIAKLISTFTYIEKAFVKSDKKNRKMLEEAFHFSLRYFEIEKYLEAKTHIDYIGDYLRIEYSDEVLNYEIRYSNNYVMPKLLYMPAERNLCALAMNLLTINDLPENISDMIREFMVANNALSNKGYNIPFADIHYHFDSNATKFYIEDKNKTYSIELSESASGFKSAIPILLLSEYISKKVVSTTSNPFSGASYIAKRETYKLLDEIVLSPFGTSSVIEYITKHKDDDSAYPILLDIISKRSEDESMVESKTPVYGRKTIPEAIDKFFRSLSRIISSYSFIIIEEPEQNLFPSYQMNIISELLKKNNMLDNNKLILTTHSPYVLESINNLIMAYDVKEKCKGIIDPDSAVRYDDVVAYSVHDGVISTIMDDNLKQIDPYEINQCSVEISQVYDQLLNLKDSDNE